MEFSELTNESTKLGLSIINSNLGITVLPIYGYRENYEMIRGQPNVGGCKLYPIFSEGINEAFKLLHGDNQGQYTSSIINLNYFFCDIRVPLLGDRDGGLKLLNFLEDME